MKADGTRIEPWADTWARLARYPVHTQLLQVLAIDSVTAGDVVDDHIACDVVQGLLPRDAARRPSDHHSELELPIRLRHIGGQDDRVERPRDSRLCLAEEKWRPVSGPLIHHLRAGCEPLLETQAFVFVIRLGNEELHHVLFVVRAGTEDLSGRFTGG